MTIALGFRFGDGLLLCADTQLTAGMKIYDTKIYPHMFAHAGDSKVVFALSGNVPLAKMTITLCAQSISSIAEGEFHKEAIVDRIRDTLVEVHNKYIYPHPDRGAGTQDVSFIIGVWSHIDGLGAYYTCETTVDEFVDVQCVGSGNYLAKYLIGSVLRQLGMALEPTTLLAIYVLSECKAYDAFCGGHSEFIVLRNRGPFSGIGQLDISQGQLFSSEIRQVIGRSLLPLGNWQSNPKDFQAELSRLVRGLKQIRRKQVSAKKRNDKQLWEYMELIKQLEEEKKSVAGLREQIKQLAAQTSEDSR